MKTISTVHKKIETPLGAMFAIGDDRAVCLLQFLDCKGLEREVVRLEKGKGAKIMPGTTAPLETLEKELGQYFKGALFEFTTPCEYNGTPFQKGVWERLRKIQYGETCSYAGVAASIGKPTAFRAVANANAANVLTIVTPCHRVINSNGDLGGYAGNIERKQWLLNLERSDLSRRQHHVSR